MTDKCTVKIALVDDDPFMLELLGYMLKNLGYAALSSYTSGRAALDAFAAAGPPDLILLDLNMPEMDGIEFVRHLVETRYAGSLILVSGEDERMLQAASKLVRAHQIRVLGHLQKPATPDALAALLAKWSPPALGRQRATPVAYGADAVRAAIANGELVNYYQPKVAVGSGAMVGVEPWCAGSIRSMAWSFPTSSSAWPRRTA